jgi:subtilase family serine protease
VTLDADTTCRALFGVAGDADLTGSWITLKQVCRGSSGSVPCRLKGRFRVRNAGAGRSAASVLQFVVSLDGATPATPLTQVRVPAMAPGRVRRIRLRAAVPGGGRAAGMFVLAMIDGEGSVAESNETNNVITFGPLP